MQNTPAPARPRPVARRRVPVQIVRSRTLGGACAYETDPSLKVPSLLDLLQRAPDLDNVDRRDQNWEAWEARAVQTRIGYPGCGPRPAPVIVAWRQHNAAAWAAEEGQ